MDFPLYQFLVNQTEKVDIVRSFLTSEVLKVMRLGRKCKTREPIRRRVSSNVGNFKKERRLTRNKKREI